VLSNTGNTQGGLDEYAYRFGKILAFHVVTPIFHPQALWQATLWIAVHILVSLPGARITNKDLVLQNSGYEYCFRSQKCWQVS
jgi:hypothetical protein